MLRLREAFQTVEQRGAQLMQARVCQLHLGLDAGGTDNVEVGRGIHEILQQRRLPNSGFPSDHERASCARADLGDDPVEHRAFRTPPAQSRQPFR